MKTYKRPAASKLVKRFDSELRDILMNDLKSFMAKNQFLSNKRANGHTLSVA